MKRSPAGLIAMIVSLTMMTGCDRGTPATPTTPTQTQNPTPPAVAPTLTALLVSYVPGLVVVGSSMQVVASGRYSDGSLQSVQPQWSVTPAAAADISPSGMLTARNPADITITARFEGLETRVSSTRVVADYSGTWRGTWRRLECFGRRCGQGDFANPVVDLLIVHNQNGRALSAVMLFGPWDATRYALSGRGFSASGSSFSLGLFWLERGPNGERQVEISTGGPIVLSTAQTLNGRWSMQFTESGEVTRLEFTLNDLALVSRAVRMPDGHTGPGLQ